MRSNSSRSSRRAIGPVRRSPASASVSSSPRLRDALNAKEIDFAVHSYKDLPTAPADGLPIAAVPVREDPRDALVARDGLTLHGAAGRCPDRYRLGAADRGHRARSACQSNVVPIRGNVDTRLRKVADGELDAVVLARAGLARLGRVDEITEILDPMLILPAPAQGALAVECRADDADLVAALAALDDPHSRAAVTAERALLAALEAGCSAPVAGLAEVVIPSVIPSAIGRAVPDSSGNAAGGGGPEIHLRGAVYQPRRANRPPAVAHRNARRRREQIGRLLAADLLDAGADKLLGVQE